TRPFLSIDFSKVERNSMLRDPPLVCPPRARLAAVQAVATTPLPPRKYSHLKWLNVRSFPVVFIIIYLKLINLLQSLIRYQFLQVALDIFGLIWDYLGEYG